MAPRAPSADRPIASYGEDVLGRTPFARLLAEETLSAPVDAGFVVGLAGPWGTGKTSALKLVELEIGDRASVVWFNPWLFTGTEQLIALFFAEIGGQLKSKGGRRLKQLGGALADFGGVIAPAASAVFGAAGGLAELPNRLRELSKKPARARYDELETQLLATKKRIVVFIDDLDRLQRREVREVVRLVKLVGDLPYVTYVLAYDQARIERALGDKTETGRSYLEKIVQAPYALPAIPRTRLQTLALEDLQAALEGAQLHHWDQDQWTQLAPLVVAFIDTVRGARRYANVARAALDLVWDEVAAADVLALTALRVFEPAVHSALAHVQVELTGGTERFDLRDQTVISKEQEERLEDEVLARATREEETRELLRGLFPAARLGSSPTTGNERSLRAAHRVAIQSVLSAYLHATLDPSVLPSRDLERVLHALSDPEALHEVLEDVPDAQLADLLDRLRDHRDQFPTDHVDRVALEFLALDARVPREEGLFAIPSGLSILWLVKDLIAHIPAGKARTEAIHNLFALAPNLSIRAQVIREFGTSPESPRDDDEPALDPSATTELESRLAEQIVAAPQDALAREFRLGFLLALLRHVDAEASVAFARRAALNDRLFLAMAGICVRRTHSSAPPFLRTTLDSDALTDLFGDLDVVRRRAQEIAASSTAESDEERATLTLLLEIRHRE